MSSNSPVTMQTVHWVASSGWVLNHLPPNWTMSTWEMRVAIQMIQKIGLLKRP